jgi:hypothetical protein
MLMLSEARREALSSLVAATTTRRISSSAVTPEDLTGGVAIPALLPSTPPPGSRCCPSAATAGDDCSSTASESASMVSAPSVRCFRRMARALSFTIVTTARLGSEPSDWLRAALWRTSSAACGGMAGMPSRAPPLVRARARSP